MGISFTIENESDMQNCFENIVPKRRNKKMKTALTRTKDENLKIFRSDDYKTNKEFEEDLKGNGYKVLKVWNDNITDIEIDKWEFMNRK